MFHVMGTLLRNGCVEVLGVCFVAVQINSSFVKIGEYNHSECSEIDRVLDQVHQFVHAFGVDRTIHHDFLSLT